MKEKNKEWTEIITAESSWFDFKLKEVWHYRDLVSIFVWRDFVATYKQTLLGPVWHFINPILSTLINTIIFGVIAGISTEGVPALLFQLCGITCWNYFNKSIAAVQSTFVANAGIFGKVYFPRLVVPISSLVSVLIQFSIMMSLFIAGWLYYKFVADAPLVINPWGFVILPLMLALMTIQGFGIGAIIAAFSTKYRDLNNLVAYGITFLMYASAVVYPVSAAKERFAKYAYWLDYNPLVHVMEGCRYALLNIGTFSVGGLLYSLIFGIIIFFLGLIAFNQTERDFIDSV
jgi:lipopolysaccharide transport system permease protein